MLESIMITEGVYYGMAACASVGVFSKVLVSSSLNRLVKAGGNMSKSTHKFMKLVRAKFEHACMANNGVDNVGVFVDKYIREYKIIGLNLHSWRKLEKVMLLLVAGFGMVGSGFSYYNGASNDIVIRTGGVAFITLAVMLGTYQIVDENYRLASLRIYMVDYLENVCARRYKKSNTSIRMNSEMSSVSQETKVLEPVIPMQEENTQNNITVNDYVQQTSPSKSQISNKPENQEVSLEYDNKGEVKEMGGTKGITQDQAVRLKKAKITRIHGKTVGSNINIRLTQSGPKDKEGIIPNLPEKNAVENKVNGHPEKEKEILTPVQKILLEESENAANTVETKEEQKAICVEKSEESKVYNDFEIKVEKENSINKATIRAILEEFMA